MTKTNHQASCFHEYGNKKMSWLNCNFYSWIHFPLIRRAAKRQARMKQSTSMAIHTPVTPRFRILVAIQTIPIRRPHMPRMLIIREKFTSPEPRQIPPAITVKLKKISVAAAMRSVMRPRAITCSQR